MKQKGFTIIELLILIVIIGTFFVIVLFAIQGSKAKDEDFCRMYRYSSIKDVPARCFNYFSSENRDTNGDIE